MINTKSKVSDQWAFDNWKNINKAEYVQWRNFRIFVMADYFMPTKYKPSSKYMEWYKLVTTDYVSECRLLVNSHEQALSSNVQHI